MQPASHQFLKDLLHTPSPSGYEKPIQDVVRAWARKYADEVKTDRHGNVIAVRHPSAPVRIMLAGHCDQLGLLVEYIDDNGFLYIQPIGGWDMQILLGQSLSVWTKHGPINGVVARRAPHLMTGDEKKKVPEFHDVWIDIGAKDKKEAQELVTIGDPVTVTLGYRELRNDLAYSPGMDDKVGVWTVMETLRLLSERKLQAAVYCVSTVQEEIGLRGATTSSYGINPQVGIAVDVTHATDTPGNDKKQIGEVGVGKGPVIVRGPNINPHVFGLLTEQARTHELPHQVKAYPRGTGTDANAMQLSREGVATGLVGIPNRYMHSPVEVVSLTDLDNAAHLLAEFCASVSPAMDWTP
jgi:tetrahedral aminopeptidase